RPVDQQHFRVLPDNHAGTLNHGLRVRPDHHHNHSLHLIAIIIDSRDISSLQSKLTEYLQHLSVDLDQFAHAVVLLVAPLIGSVLILRSHSALFDVFNQSVLYVPQGHVVVDEVKVMPPIHSLPLQLVNQILPNLLSNLIFFRLGHTTSPPKT